MSSSSSYAIIETVKEETVMVSPEEQNAEFVKFLILLAIVLLVLYIVANNPNANYYTITLPSWAPTLLTWALLFLLIFILTAFAASKLSLNLADGKAGWG